MQLVLSSFLVVYLTRSAGLDLVLAGAPASLQAWRPPRLGLRRRSGGVTAPAAAWHSTADGRRCWIDEPVYHGMAGGRDRSRRHFAWRHRERLERRVPCGTRRPQGGSRPRDFGKPDVHLLGIVLGPSLFGALASAVGFPKAYIVMGTTVLLGGILGAFKPRGQSDNAQARQSDLPG
jgi:hypothetical protein